MSLSVSQGKALQALLAKRSEAALKRLFALIRAHDDRTLLAARPAPRKSKRQRASDPLVRDVTRLLLPLLAPASEKAELLIGRLAAKHRRKLDIAPRGLADTVRRLRATFTDAQIRAGANSLIRDLAKLYGARETVV